MRIKLTEDFYHNSELILKIGEKIEVSKESLNYVFKTKLISVVADKKVEERSSRIKVGDKFYVSLDNAIFLFADYVPSMKYMAADGKEFEDEDKCDRYDYQLLQEAKKNRKENDLWFTTFSWLAGVSSALLIMSILVFAKGDYKQSMLYMWISIVMGVCAIFVRVIKL